MRFLRWIARWIAGITQFTLFTLLFFALMGAAGYWVALQFFGGREITTPDLTGDSLRQALVKLADADISLYLERREPHVQVPEGHIISQFPRPGTTIKAGTPVRIVLSEGRPLVAVPDLRGRSRIEAGIRLRKLGLDVGASAVIPRAGIPGGTVLSTEPPAGSGVVEGARVNLLLAAGEGVQARQMPNLIGLTRQEATEVLDSYGLRVDRVRETAAGDAAVPAGQVHAQSPPPGATISPPTSIELSVQPAPAEPTPATPASL